MAHLTPALGGTLAPLLRGQASGLLLMARRAAIRTATPPATPAEAAETPLSELISKRTAIAPATIASSNSAEGTTYADRVPVTPHPGARFPAPRSQEAEATGSNRAPLPPALLRFADNRHYVNPPNCQCSRSSPFSLSRMACSCGCSAWSIGRSQPSAPSRDRIIEGIGLVARKLIKATSGRSRFVG
jgi:hypothetical protein